jgi:hypothetical protein
MPLPVLKKVLGHASIRTTALYWKDSSEPKEKVIRDKWLTGKIPKEPIKPIAEQPQELSKPLKGKREISPPNQPRNSKPKLLTTENKNLKEKIKQLEQERQEQEQIIINLKNELIQTQSEKETLLRILSADLKKQQANLSYPEQNNYELHQQLITQIEVLVKIW